MRSFRSRVVVAVGLASTLALGIFLTFVFVVFGGQLRSALDGELADYGGTIESALRNGRSIPAPSIGSGELGGLVIAPDGSVTSSASSFELELEHGEDEADGGEDEGEEEAGSFGVLISTAGPSPSYVDLRGEHGVALRAWVKRIDIDGDAWIIASVAPRSSAGSPVTKLAIVSLIGLAAAVVVVALVAWWVGGRVTRPLSKLAGDVRSLDETRLDQRVDVPQGPVEVAELAGALDSLMDRISSSVFHERTFVANASHELRSPLAALRGELELARRSNDADRIQAGLVGAIEETDRLAHLVDDLLLLARAEAGVAPPTERVSLADAASAAIVRQQGAAARRGVELRLEGDDASVTGSTVLIERAIENLIDNALRFAPEPSVVTVRLWSEDSYCGVEVADRGPGIAPEDRERVLDRFARLDEGRGRSEGGTGLGLAIVKGVVEHLKGSVTIGETEGGGATITIAFPRS